MDQKSNHLKSRQQEQQMTHVESRGQATITEYESVEQALRADRERIPLPEQLAVRVSEAIRREPPKPVSWWARWFNRGGSPGN